MDAIKQGKHKVQVVIGREEGDERHNQFCEMMYRNQERNELYYVQLHDENPNDESVEKGNTVAISNGGAGKWITTNSARLSKNSKQLWEPECEPECKNKEETFEEDRREHEMGRIKQTVMKAAIATMTSEGRVTTGGTGITSAVDELKDYEWSEYWDDLSGEPFEPKLVQAARKE